jgi:hypothetical protein
MSLTRSLIPQQHRPILDQLLVRLSLRQGQVSVSRVIAERSGKRSVPEILKPSQNQPLYNSKDHRGQTPNMSAPFFASSGPSNRHHGVRRRPPEPNVVSSHQYSIAAPADGKTCDQ